MTQKELNKIIENLTYNEYRVYSILEEGEDCKRTKADIANYTNFDVRTIKTIVKNLRLKGLPICSQTGFGGGYWIEWNKKRFGQFVAEQKIEVEGYLKSLDNLIVIYKSLKGKDSNELFI